MDSLVTVVIPAHNSRPYIAPALDSILVQKYRPIEILVVDDGSTDSTVQMVRGYAPEVRVIEQEQRGHPAARNAGIRAASGEFLGFLDHDDLWSPDKLELQIASFERNPDARLSLWAYPEFFHSGNAAGRARAPGRSVAAAAWLIAGRHAGAPPIVRPCRTVFRGALHGRFSRLVRPRHAGADERRNAAGNGGLPAHPCEQLSAQAPTPAPGESSCRERSAGPAPRNFGVAFYDVDPVVRSYGVAGRKIVAVVFLAIDGFGLGHLIRSSIVSHALASIGERPVIFTEGKYRPAALTKFPIRLVPPLHGVTDEVRKRVSSELLSMAAISLPAVLVEDTHPAPIELPAAVRRVLLVRPTSFEYLVRLNDRLGALYSAFLLCDSPDSPTWPYDDVQTRQLAGWKKWSVIGPLYRTPSEEEIQEVRTRHSVSEDQELCVFTMASGGVHVFDTKGQDIIRFLRLASQVADVVQTARPTPRMMFVRGPYFPPRIPIPSRFEIVREEPQMPALLKIAKGAVIRTGFNTTWECLSAGTPFMPMIGTGYVEPFAARLNRMASLGLVPSNIESFWFDDQWRAEYRRTVAGIVAAHSGAPDPRRVGGLILGPQRTRPTAMRKPRASRPSSAKHRIPLVIRIDDVVCEEPALCWLLDLLASRGMRASLEVVPYLVRLDQAFLDRFDPSGALFEVSQHGYAHVPRTSDSGRRCEFSPETASAHTGGIRSHRAGQDANGEGISETIQRRIFAALRCAACLVARHVAYARRRLRVVPSHQLHARSAAAGQASGSRGVGLDHGSRSWPGRSDTKAGGPTRLGRSRGDRAAPAVPSRSAGKIASPEPVELLGSGRRRDGIFEGPRAGKSRGRNSACADRPALEIVRWKAVARAAWRR